MSGTPFLVLMIRQNWKICTMNVSTYDCYLKLKSIHFI